MPATRHKTVSSNSAKQTAASWQTRSNGSSRDDNGASRASKRRRTGSNDGEDGGDNGAAAVIPWPKMDERQLKLCLQLFPATQRCSGCIQFANSPSVNVLASIDDRDHDAKTDECLSKRCDASDDDAQRPWKMSNRGVWTGFKIANIPKNKRLVQCK